VLLSKNKSADEKKKILEEEFGIAMTKTIEKEAEEMFDYGDYVEEMGRREGKREGIITSLKNLIKNANMPLEQAMAVLEIPEKDRPMYAVELKQ
ncbi:MAG: hypothetical protein K2K21_11455, partial [Lachnospiraceae bacterium]|nr:hypothetical protein [Lachnospiraceae bacterium]